MQAEDEIFTVRCRRCLRCGGILLSEQGLRDGYGHTCKRKAAEEAAQRQLMKAQMSWFGEEKEE
jgi:hypothetical protein